MKLKWNFQMGGGGRGSQKKALMLEGGGGGVGYFMELPGYYL